MCYVYIMDNETKNKRNWTMKEIKIDESKYVNAHGKKPRGFGHWYFKANSETFFVIDIYSVAKAEARRRAADFGARDCALLS